MNPLRLVSKAMKKGGLSQSDLAQRLGINQANLSRILRGLQSPSDETKEAFSRELGIPASSWPKKLRKSTLASLRHADRAPTTEAAA